jgi:NADPH:quinone reductase-like Zn-dependent oxidoreductase
VVGDSEEEVAMKAFALADEASGGSFLEIPAPEPGAGEVRVRIRASSVNGWDVFVASGMARGMMEHRYPAVTGKDYAGVVDTIGEGVTRFSVGDEVAGIAPPEQHVGRGSYAEYLVVPAEGFIEPKPDTLSFEQAASVGLAALTALVATDAVEVAKGETVLIAGATGGVGTYAVQLAAGRGASVIATALPEDESWIRGLGASEVIDYSGDVAAAVRSAHADGIDGLIDAVNRGDAHGPLAELVKDGGRIATTTGAADVEALAKRSVAAANVVGQTDPGPFANVLAMAGDGELVVPITRTFAFDQLPEALGLVGSRSSRGKFAVTIGE